MSTAKKGTPRKAAPKPLIDAQPASRQQAAEAGEIFLYTDDSWSQDYFNEKDFHSLERKLFG